MADDENLSDPRFEKLENLFNVFADKREAKRAEAAAAKAKEDADKNKGGDFFGFLDDLFPDSK